MTVGRMWIIVGASLIGAIALSVGWGYAYTYTADALHSRNVASEELSRLSGQDSRTRALNMNIRDTRDGRVVLEQFIFDADLLDAIQIIENTAEKAGADIKITSVGQQQKLGETVIMTPLSLTLEGSYPAVFNAIRTFESFPYLVSVTQLSIEKSLSGKGTVATVHIEVVHRPEGVTARSQE